MKKIIRFLAKISGVESDIINENKKRNREIFCFGTFKINEERFFKGKESASALTAYKQFNKVNGTNFAFTTKKIKGGILLKRNK